MLQLPGRLVLLGTQVERSLSPLMQNAALADANIPLRYEPLAVTVENLDHCLQALIVARAAGNVTIPHKENVAARCNELTAVAHRAGAVNTFWTRGTSLIGDNTDVEGFQALARKALDESPRGATVALLGAGGAAAAVLIAIAEWPQTRIRVHARTPERAHELIARVAVAASVTRDIAEAVADATIVINATPIGSANDQHPVQLERLRSDAAVIDLVYRSSESSWVRAARAAGHRAADGRAMLVEQGAIAFERWFGRAPNRQVMWQALR